MNSLGYYDFLTHRIFLHPIHHVGDKIFAFIWTQGSLYLVFSVHILISYRARFTQYLQKAGWSHLLPDSVTSQDCILTDVGQLGIENIPFSLGLLEQVSKGLLLFQDIMLQLQGEKKSRKLDHLPKRTDVWWEVLKMNSDLPTVINLEQNNISNSFKKAHIDESNK